MSTNDKATWWSNQNGDRLVQAAMASAETRIAALAADKQDAARAIATDLFVNGKENRIKHWCDIIGTSIPDVRPFLYKPSSQPMSKSPPSEATDPQAEQRNKLARLRQTAKELGLSDALEPYRAATNDEWDKIRHSPHDQFMRNLGPPKSLMNSDPKTTWLGREDFDFSMSSPTVEVVASLADIAATARKRAEEIKLERQPPKV